MGHKLSCLTEESEDTENSFEEVERRKTRDGGENDLRQRRKSSGLSRYSTDCQHVIEEPLKIAAFNVRRFGTAKMKDKDVVDILGILYSIVYIFSILIFIFTSQDCGSV